jgi:hypothetical protein
MALFGHRATRFPCCLGGQASRPISCCCNDMLRLDSHLEGAPSLAKSGEKWRFPSRIRAFVHWSDLTVFWLECPSRHIVCCESSAFILRPSSFIGAAVGLRAQGTEPAVRWMVRYPDPSRSGGLGRPVPSAGLICAIARASDRGMKTRGSGCLRKGPTYGQNTLFSSAVDLALVTFAVERVISFLAKVHGQLVICHGESFARNPRFQRTLGGSARTGHGCHLSLFGGFVSPATLLAWMHLAAYLMRRRNAGPRTPGWR